MRTKRSYQVPGILAVASLAGSFLLSSCSSNGMMVYQNTRHVGSKNNITAGRGMFGLNQNRKSTKPKTMRPIEVSTISPVKRRPQKVRRQNKPTFKTYIIQKGDTLSQIALDHKVGIDELALLNNMDKNDMIRIGQKLKLPGNAAVVTHTNRPKAVATPSVDYYTVQKGDFLGKIALKTKTSVADLRSWNNLKSDKIHIGWKLALGPGGKPEIKHPVSSSMRATKAIPANGIHVVKSGESISSIATMYKGMTSSKLKSINGLSSNMIIPGQELKLRGGTPDFGTTTRVTTTAPVVEEMVTADDTPAKPVSTTPPMSLPHFVDQQNDTLEGVANMYGSKVEWILDKNPGIKTDSDLRGMKEISVPVQE